MPFLSPFVHQTYLEDGTQSSNDLLVVPVAIDHIARTSPDAVFASIPKSNNVADGFRNLTYLEYAHAIDRATVWLETKLHNNAKNKRIGYLAPSDLRYLILTVAAVKLDSQVSEDQTN